MAVGEKGDLRVIHGGFPHVEGTEGVSRNKGTGGVQKKNFSLNSGGLAALEQSRDVPVVGGVLGKDDPREKKLRIEFMDALLKYAFSDKK